VTPITLIADDDSTHRNFLRSKLGAKSQRLASEVVISDVVIPNADCSQLCEEVLRREHDIDQYVIYSGSPASAGQRDRERSAALRTLLETGPDCVYVMARTGVVTEINRAGLEMLEATTLEDLLIRPFIEYVAPEYRATFQGCAEAAWRGEPSCAEFEIRGLKGGQRGLEMRAVPLRNPQGQILSLMGILRDCTERKHLEQQILQSQKMEAIGQLAGGVAHDFNNMVGIIMGYADLLLSEAGPDSPLHDYAQTIFHTSERAAALTRQLLGFSRKQAPQSGILDVSEIITGIDPMLRRLIGENIKLVTLPEPELGKIEADSGQIEQVLMNLSVNARDAMPEGGILCIETSNVTLEKGHPEEANIPAGEYVLLAVADTGTGMTEEVKTKMFEAFFTTKSVGKGTGLGLATCQSILRCWGGYVAVDSEVGVGTTFRVYLPRVASSDKPVQRPSGESAVLPRGEETILLVEDEPGLLDLATSVLQKQGYTVLTAGNGREALRMVREHWGEPIGLVLTDMVMPEMGGKVMAEWMRTVIPDSRILFTSGYTDSGIVNGGELEVGIEFLPKPYTPSALARKVREVLDRPCH
jgi:two-component system, cell cycle sensor histidine kinase and response regulator CckA